MSLRIGFFADFKGADTVLLAGQPEGIAMLSARLARFVTSSETELPIHELAWVAPRHTAQLFASRSQPPKPQGFEWLCSPDTVGPITAALETLAERGLGHQYFDLAGSPAQLLVSCGEYSEAWWQAHG